MNRLRSRLTLRQLEDRTTPVVWNNPWPDANHLTLSFAPDGTAVGSAPSVLFAELSSLPTSDWQTEVLRAFQSWAAQANINLSVVGDSGVAFGTPGPVQGSPLHGDVRIGATDLSAGELAISTPFDLLSGWSGSVLLNSAMTVGLGDPAASDLYTVLLQETGHIFGVGNSTDPDSAMFEQYQGPRTGLDAADIADIQTLYGAREADRFEGTAGNDSTALATRLRFITSLGQLGTSDGSAGLSPYVATGDVTTPSDVDFYSVRVPYGVRGFAASLRTSGISLLTARLTVFDAGGREVGSAVAMDPLTGDLKVSVPSARPGAVYFVRVEGADDNVFGIGSYRLAVGTVASAALRPVNSFGLVNDDGIAARPPIFLGTQPRGSDLRWDFTYRASVSGPADTDAYTVRTQWGRSETMVVVVWRLAGGRFDPSITVYDSSNRPVPVQVLSDDSGSLTVQLRDVRPFSTYTISIGGNRARLGASRGNYFLGVDFRDSPVTLSRIAKGVLTAENPDVSVAMTVAQDQLFHFALSAGTTNADVASAVRLIVLDESGNEVYTLFAAAGTSASGDVLLAAGNYTVIVTAGTPDGAKELPTLTYRLSGLVRTDPIGIGTEDPTSSPAQPEPNPAPPTTSTNPYNGPYTNPYRPT